MLISKPLYRNIISYILSPLVCLEVLQHNFIRRFSPKKLVYLAIAFAFIAPEFPALPHLACAQDPFKYEISPEDAPHFKKPIGIYSAGETVYFSGEFRTGYQFSIPPARGDLVPEVSLEYSSNANPSIVGRGWRIPIDHISRSLRRGVPQYLGPGEADLQDEFEFRLGKHSGSLVFIGSSGPGVYLYRAIREGVFAKFYYHSLSDTWRVLHPSGNVWVLGIDDARDANGGLVFAWYVKTITDPDGNQIKYSYTRANGVLYPDSIDYDLSTQVSVSEHPYLFFEWSDNDSYSQISYKKGYRAIWDAKRLSEIRIGYANSDGTALYPKMYSLIYDTETGNIHHNLKTFWPPSLPRTEFSYYGFTTQFDSRKTIPNHELFTDWQHNLSVIRIKNLNLSATVQELRTTSVLIDMDADGDQDLLFVRSSKDTPLVPKSSTGGHGNYWYWRENVEGDWNPNLKKITIPQCYDPSALRIDRKDNQFTTRRQDVLDITGDAWPDLIYILGAKIYVCKGTGSGFENTCQPWNSPPDVSLLGLGRTVKGASTSWDDAALLDMNGDGLRDYVVTRYVPDRLIVYLNSGGGFRKGYTISMKNSLPYMIPGGAIRAAEYGPNGDSLIRDLRDMNGDGLLDLVESPTGKGLTIFYGYGNDPGFDYDNKTIFGLGQISQSRLASGFTAMKQTLAGLHDVNGDHLLDIFGYSGGQYYVYLNTGTSFTSRQPWPVLSSSTCSEHPGLGNVVSAPAKAYYSNSDSDTYVGVKQAILDFNGDGQIEIVTVPFSISTLESGVYFMRYKQSIGTSKWILDLPGYKYDDLTGKYYSILKPPQGTDSLFATKWCLLCGKAEPTHRLEQVSAGNGVTTSLVYGFPKTYQSSTPFPIWAVTVVDRYDLATDDHRQTYLNSCNPKYDHVRREFRGFESVFEDQGNLRIIWHKYRQGEYDQGIEYEKAIYDYGNNLLQANHFGISTTTYSNPLCRWAMKSDEWKTVYDPDGSSVETWTHYTYDTNHGQIKKISYNGYEDENDDQRVHKFDYYILETNDNYMVRKKRETRENWHGVKANQTEWQYDTQCTNPSAPLSKGHLCAKIDWRGMGGASAKTSFTYDSMGRLDSVTDPDQIKLTYDYYGQTSHRKSETNLLGHKVLYQWYDKFSGQPRRICGPQSDNSGALRCDRTEFDLYGRPVEIYKAVNDHNTGNYNTVRVSKLTYVDKASLLKPTHVTAVHDPDPLTGKMPKREVEVYYDGEGRVIKHGYSAGAKWAANYYAYDWFGNLFRAWLPLSEVAGTGFKRPALGPHCSPVCISGYSYKHDLLNRPIQTYGPDGIETTVEYRGPEVFVKDPRGNTTRYQISAFGEIIAVEQDVGGHKLKSEFTYEAASRITKVIDPDGAFYEYSYYGDGLIHEAKLPTSPYVYQPGVWTYHRTPGGRVKIAEDPNKSIVEYQYDALGRPAKRHLFSGKGICMSGLDQAEDYYYDKDSSQLGYLNRVQSDKYLLTMEYDAQGNLENKELSDLALGVKLKYSRKYSALGDMVSTTYPKGRVVSFDYDNAGRVDYISDSGKGKLNATLNYYVDGRLESISGSMGSISGKPKALVWKRTYSYDSKHRLERIDSNISGTPWIIEYGYDRNDNINEMQDSLRSLHYNWLYDEANRLFEAQGYGDSSGTYKYSYNDNSSLKTVNVPSGEIYSYQYTDARHQVLQSISSSNHVTSYKSDPKTGQRCSVGTGLGKKYSHSWTADGRLYSIEKGDGPDQFVTRFFYNYNGDRWRRLHNDIVTIYLDDLLEYNSQSGVIIERLNLPGMICTLLGSQDGECSFLDIMNVAAVFNESGSLVESATYSPYGQLITLAGTVEMDFDYNGKRRETGGNVLYYGARYYDPTSRQWFSVDPILLSGIESVRSQVSIHPFGYAASNPTSLIDRYGLQPSDAGPPKDAGSPKDAGPAGGPEAPAAPAPAAPKQPQSFGEVEIFKIRFAKDEKGRLIVTTEELLREMAWYYNYKLRKASPASDWNTVKRIMKKLDTSFYDISKHSKYKHHRFVFLGQEFTAEEINYIGIGMGFEHFSVFRKMTKADIHSIVILLNLKYPSVATFGEHFFTRLGMKLYPYVEKK